jgi:hypothetical protein
MKLPTKEELTNVSNDLDIKRKKFLAKCLKKDLNCSRKFLAKSLKIARRKRLSSFEWTFRNTCQHLQIWETAKQMSKELIDAGYRISDWQKDLVKSFPYMTIYLDYEDNDGK